MSTTCARTGLPRSNVSASVQYDWMAARARAAANEARSIAARWRELAQVG